MWNLSLPWHWKSLRVTTGKSEDCAEVADQRWLRWQHWSWSQVTINMPGCSRMDVSIDLSGFFLISTDFNSFKVICGIPKKKIIMSHWLSKWGEGKVSANCFLKVLFLLTHIPFYPSVMHSGWFQCTFYEFELEMTLG